MKLVFFSGDKQEVQRVEQALVVAGIRCKVRDRTMSKGARCTARETELWVLKDRDSSRAFLKCVEAGVGFGKPTLQFAQKLLWDETVSG